VTAINAEHLGIHTPILPEEVVHGLDFVPLWSMSS
jgi:hypothetical protein